MATDVSDARSLGSWEEAFQHPMPTVRRVEQELRRDIANNREKLRSLVGVRYRDLLGTAQTIVGMNEQIQQVESNLVNIGRNCNPRLLERKVSHLHELKDQGSEKVVKDRKFSAQLTLLHNCTSAISRILRARGSSVLAAKLLVICRLLHKSLTQDKNAPSFVDGLRGQLASLRHTLLKRIDKRMISVGSTTNDIIESMSAFCLANSSSLEDAVRHFHRIRQEAMSFRLTRQGATHDTIVQALNLYISTLQRTAELLSGRLADALGRLTAKPLMSDPVIQNMGELGIDILYGWITDDIKNFTPWIKHTHLTKQEANKITKQWSKATFDRLCSDAGKFLYGSHDFGELISLRNQLLHAWLPVQYSTPSHSPLEVLQGIRDLINNQLVSILRAQSKGLTSLGDGISSAITSWSESEHQHTAQSLWEPDITFLDFSEGATTFKDEIVNRMLGKSQGILRVLESYQAWMSSVQKRQSTIGELRRAKWEDVAEEDEDEELDGVDEMLAEDDPDLLQKEHETSLCDGFTTLQDSLHGTLSNMESAHRAPQAAFMLRIVREVRRRIPDEHPKDGNQLFARDLVTQLYNILAVETVSRLRFPSLTCGLKYPRSKCPGRTLWEGDHPLPIQPSPMTFKFLRRLTMTMAQQGYDLWNPDAVNEMKTQLIKQLASSTREALPDIPSLEDKESGNPSAEGEPGNSDDTPEEGSENPNDKPEDSTAENVPLEPRASSDMKLDVIRGNKIQLLFDLLYLNEAFAPHEPPQPNETEVFKAVTATLETELEFSEEVKKTLTNRAQDYWIRTRLLFGLLG